MKLELEAGEAKATKNLALSVNLPASSTVFTNADDFDPSNPETFNSSTSVTIFDNLNPRQEAQVFLDVNKKQEKVNPNLTLEIQRMIGVIGEPKDQIISLSQSVILGLSNPKNKKTNSTSIKKRTLNKKNGTEEKLNKNTVNEKKREPKVSEPLKVVNVDEVKKAKKGGWWSQAK